MKVLHKHNVYLDKVQSGIYINAMQADAYTRILEFSLYSGGVAWKVPQGVSVAVAYGGASGHGVYDTLPDGSPACTVSGNVVTAVVVPQAVSMYGNTNLTIIFTDGNGKQLTAFCVTLKVERNPAVGAAKLPSYINMRQWLTDELSKMLLDFNIIVFPAGDGYITEEAMEDIQAAFKAGRAMRCVLKTDSQELLYLPLSKEQRGVYHFATVCDGMEWLVTIAAGDDGNAVTTVTHDAVGSGGVYVGSEEPEDESVNVWINPDGETYDPPQGAASLQPLTFTGAGEIVYDGTQPIQVEIPTDDHINELIDSALAGIPNASEVAY